MGDNTAMVPAMTIRVLGGIPAVVAYLHSLAAAGHGSVYDAHSKRVTVHILSVDRAKYKELETVDSVVLDYQGTKVNTEEQK